MVMVMVVVGCQEAIQSKNCNDDSLHLPHKPSKVTGHDGLDRENSNRFGFTASMMAVLSESEMRTTRMVALQKFFAAQRASVRAQESLLWSYQQKR
jgi:hypothetical protein